MMQPNFALKEWFASDDLWGLDLTVPLELGKGKGNPE